jgi:hypothetical protein
MYSLDESPGVRHWHAGWTGAICAGASGRTVIQVVCVGVQGSTAGRLVLLDTTAAAASQPLPSDVAGS